MHLLVEFTIELPASDDKLPGFAIQPRIPAEVGAELRLREDIRLLIRAGSNINALFGLVIRPNEFTVKYPFSDGTTLPEAGFGMGFVFNPAEPFILFGAPNDIRLQLKGIEIDFDFHFTVEEPEVILKLAMQELALVIAASDGFCASCWEMVKSSWTFLWMWSGLTRMVSNLLAVVDSKLQRILISHSVLLRSKIF